MSLTVKRASELGRVNDNISPQEWVKFFGDSGIDFTIVEDKEEGLLYITIGPTSVSKFLKVVRSISNGR